MEWKIDAVSGNHKGYDIAIEHFGGKAVIDIFTHTEKGLDWIVHLDGTGDIEADKAAAIAYVDNLGVKEDDNS